MRSLPEAPAFNLAAMRSLGWSDPAARRAAASRRITRIRAGWFTADKDVTPVAAAMAAAGAHADSAIADISALAVYDLPVVGQHRAVPALTVAPGGTGLGRGAHLYRATLRPEDLVIVGSTPVTSAPRTLIDVGRHHPLRTSVPAIDAALQRELTTREELADVMRMCHDWPGIRRAARALRLSDGRAESALESISRLAIPHLGLPVPDLQVAILNELGDEVARLDFYWDEFGAAGEADGRGKYDGRTYSDVDGLAVFDNEKVRQDRAESLRMTFGRWGWLHADRQQQVMRARIESALRRGAQLDRAGVPRRWTIERVSRI